MKQVCLHCERTSPDNNLYCQEIYCPAEMSPTILDYGEWLGDIEIIKPIVVLRSSVLYQAKHQKKKVLLKVAHPGRKNTERLKREAEFLSDIQLKKAQDEHLPRLLPAYANTTIKTNAYGRAMLRGHLLYFCLFEYFEGEPLRDVLTKNPQLWIYHIGWLLISLSSAVAFLQSKGLLHGGLSPETLLVHEDLNVPRILLFDLGLVSSSKEFSTYWDPALVQPAYTAPELLQPQLPTLGYAPDVYGLGLILYELLVGEPAFPFKLHSDQEVYAAILANSRVPMNRIEDVKPVADIALQAVSENMSNRQPHAAEIAQQLNGQFGDVPGKKPGRWPSARVTLVVVAALLVIALLITMAVTLDELYAFLV